MYSAHSTASYPLRLQSHVTPVPGAPRKEEQPDPVLQRTLPVLDSPGDDMSVSNVVSPKDVSVFIILDYYFPGSLH